MFPAINVSNTFATIDYDAHKHTKIDYTMKYVTVCEIERNQFLTILEMSVQSPQLAGFLLTGKPL